MVVMTAMTECRTTKRNGYLGVSERSWVWMWVSFERWRGVSGTLGVVHISLTSIGYGMVGRICFDFLNCVILFFPFPSLFFLAGSCI